MSQKLDSYKYGPNSNCMHPWLGSTLGSSHHNSQVCETPGRFTTNSRVGGQQDSIVVRGARACALCRP